MFLCDSGEEIPEDYVNDGYDDCYDGSDEFDDNDEGIVNEEDLDQQEKKQSKNKKHRVFDKKKKEGGIFDWLF